MINTTVEKKAGPFLKATHFFRFFFFSFYSFFLVVLMMRWCQKWEIRLKNNLCTQCVYEFSPFLVSTRFLCILLWTYSLKYSENKKLLTRGLCFRVKRDNCAKLINAHRKSKSILAVAIKFNEQRKQRRRRRETFHIITTRLGKIQMTFMLFNISIAVYIVHHYSHYFLILILLQLLTLVLRSSCLYAHKYEKGRR